MLCFHRISKIVLVALSFLLVCTSVAGQERSLGAGVYPGFLLAHRPDLKSLAAHNVGFELYGEKGVSNSNWGQNYLNPKVGASIVYYQFGGEETGAAMAGLVHLKFQVISAGSSRINLKLGTGLAYLNKPFDVFDNRRNVAIGSHLNGSMQIALLAETPIKNVIVEYGLGITHFSNAAFKIPNLGFNNPALMVRVGRAIGPAKEAKNVELEKGLNHNITLNYGRKQQDFSDPVDFNIFGLHYRALYSKKGFSKWRIGLDVALDKTYPFSTDITIDLKAVPISEQLEVAIAGGYQWNMGKVDLVAEVGTYLSKPVDFKREVLERVGVRYNITDRFAVQGLLRFHRAVADYLEMGISCDL